MKNALESIYKYVRLSHYRKLFSAIKEKAGSLSATEAFAVEIIYLLGSPTVCEFADFLGISQPNATYKTNSLVAKGYITKDNSTGDRREYRLRLTKKFMDYYGDQTPSVEEVITQAGPAFSQKQATLLRKFICDFRCAAE